MDRTEAWLREHDPDYQRASRAWRHVKSGEYQKPPREDPIGLIRDTDLPTEPVGERACGVCGNTFNPREAKHRFCTERCRGTAEKRRQRAR